MPRLFVGRYYVVPSTLSILNQFKFRNAVTCKVLSVKSGNDEEGQ